MSLAPPCFLLAGFAGRVAQASLQQDFAAYWVAGAFHTAIDHSSVSGAGLIVTRGPKD
jgi:hypothetical protein